MEGHPLLDKLIRLDRHSPHHLLLLNSLPVSFICSLPDRGGIWIWAPNLATSKMVESKPHRGRGLPSSHSTFVTKLGSKPGLTQPNSDRRQL